MDENQEGSMRKRENKASMEKKAHLKAKCAIRETVTREWTCNDGSLEVALWSDPMDEGRHEDGWIYVFHELKDQAIVAVADGSDGSSVTNNLLQGLLDRIHDPFFFSSSSSSSQPSGFLSSIYNWVHATDSYLHDQYHFIQELIWSLQELLRDPECKAKRKVIWTEEERQQIRDAIDTSRFNQTALCKTLQSELRSVLLNRDHVQLGDVKSLCKRLQVKQQWTCQSTFTVLKWSRLSPPAKHTSMLIEVFQLGNSCAALYSADGQMLWSGSGVDREFVGNWVTKGCAWAELPHHQLSHIPDQKRQKVYSAHSPILISSAQQQQQLQQHRVSDCVASGEMFRFTIDVPEQTFLILATHGFWCRYTVKEVGRIVASQLAQKQTVSQILTHLVRVRFLRPPDKNLPCHATRPNLTVFLLLMNQRRK